MFSVPISVVLLVFFVSQGQTSSNVSPNVYATVGPNVHATVNVTVSPSPSSAVVSSSATTPTLPSEKTCAKLGVVIDKPWNDNYKNNASENFRNLSDAFSSALKKLYNDSAKSDTEVEVSEVHFTKNDFELFFASSAKLCLVVKGGDDVFIEDVFKEKVESGKLDTDLPVKTDSAEFEPLGVSFKDWKAKEGECERKCEAGVGGLFFIVRECQPETGFSCKGHKTTKETEECTKYCSSTVAVSVSFAILMIGILLSSSFQ